MTALLALDQLGVAPREAVFVGDLEADRLSWWACGKAKKSSDPYVGPAILVARPQHRVLSVLAVLPVSDGSGVMVYTVGARAICVELEN